MVPPLPRYCRALRLPAAPPASLRFLRSAVPPLRLGLCSRSRKTLRLRAWGCSPESPYRFFDGDDRSSQVPGEPRYERALLFDPGGTSALGHCRASVLSSAKSTTSTPTMSSISGLNHTAHSLAVYASQGGLPHHHARLASGWLASLIRAGVATRWVPLKGFRFIHPPFPGFAWRTDFYTRANHASLPLRASGMLAVRIRQLTAEGLSPSETSSLVGRYPGLSPVGLQSYRLLLPADPGLELAKYEL